MEAITSGQYNATVGTWVSTGKSLSAGAVPFWNELRAQIERATKHGAPHIEVNAGELHRKVGGYPGPGHRMPLCCDALYFEQQPRDDLVCGPKKGKGASLTIRFMLPRRQYLGAGPLGRGTSR